MPKRAREETERAGVGAYLDVEAAEAGEEEEEEDPTEEGKLSDSNDCEDML